MVANVGVDGITERTRGEGERDGVEDKEREKKKER